MSAFEFSDTDKNEIKEAVKNLEKESSGELVLYFAKSSHSYQGASWKLAGILGGLGLCIVILLSYLWLLPAFFSPIVISFTILSMMAIGLGLAFVSPKIRMSLVAGKIIEQAAITKARDIFLQEEVFKTIDRSGILIYISELEHEVVVLGDSGINAKIQDSAWQDVVNTIVRSIKQNEPTLGIIKAIDMCKTLLLENGFIVRTDDTNELSDDIRIEE